MNEEAIKLHDVEVVAGRLVPVYNKKRHHKAKNYYYSVWVEDHHGGNERCLLFTGKEIEAAEKRSCRNPEDLTRKGWLTDMLD